MPEHWKTKNGPREKGENVTQLFPHETRIYDCQKMCKLQYRFFSTSQERAEN